MTHDCGYCNKPFTVFRKDKRYCSNSCKQMAFLKRQNVKPSIDVLGMDIIKKESNKYEPLIYGDDERGYIPVKCKWVNDLFNQFDNRGHDEWLRRHITSQVEWISIHYQCLLDCVLTISSMKVIEWVDLAELTNAFTFLITSHHFKTLPEDYPFIKSIVVLRDKLKMFCLETQNEEWVQLRLKFSTKKDLLLQRFELACVFSKISFNQLQLDFNNESDKQINKSNEAQENIEVEKEKQWRIKFRALKRANESKKQ